MMSNPPTPSEETAPPVPANNVSAALENVIASGGGSPTPPTLGSPSPSVPSMVPTMGPPTRRGHSRTASLGTTMTSPSTRRRSLESTISLIREAVDPKEEEEEAVAPQQS